MNRTTGPDETFTFAPGVPGKALGITAFVLSFFVQVVALIMGIFALFQSRRAGVSNPFAIAGVVISAVLIVAAVITWIAIAAYQGS